MESTGDIKYLKKSNGHYIINEPNGVNKEHAANGCHLNGAANGNSNTKNGHWEVKDVQKLKELRQRNAINGSEKDSAESRREEYDLRAFEFSKSVQDLINKEELLLGSKRERKVVDFKHPKELRELLSLKISEKGESNAELMAICDEIIKYSVITGNTGFFNQLIHGGDPFGITATWLIEALNTSEYTYEVAPVCVMVSEYICKRLARMAGYEEGDGIFVPGGSMGNIMSLAMARYDYSDKTKTQGLFGINRLVMFTSEDCHYSNCKGAAFLGFGMESMIAVKTDNRGCMLISDLKDKINIEMSKGHIPIAVVATAGTTVLGAFDDIEQIADVCDQYNMWMHVDACWGGGALFSSNQRHLLKGIERGDSFCISLHKIMGAPNQCVPLITKQKDILQKTFGFGASYLFQPDKFYDTSYDMGDKTIQCGRKADSLKFWMMWKAKGDEGMALQMDHAMEMAKYFSDKISKTPGFRLVMPEFQYTNVGFWYVPKSMRDEPQTEEWWQRLHKVAPKIKERMAKKGNLLIGYQPLNSRGFVNFFRIIISNPRLTHEDLDFVINEIDSLGRDL